MPIACALCVSVFTLLAVAVLVAVHIVSAYITCLMLDYVCEHVHVCVCVWMTRRAFVYVG